jgi:hypothetical protein
VVHLSIEILNYRPWGSTQMANLLFRAAVGRFRFWRSGGEQVTLCSAVVLSLRLRKTNGTDALAALKSYYTNYSVNPSVITL